MSAPDGADRRRPPRSDATILVVDDSTTIRAILRRALVAAGYVVVEAADGRVALESCRAARPDLVLLDIDMPVMDGMATMAAMSSDPELSDIPVLFLTARTGARDAAAGLDLGAQDYLRKPCEPAELTARVASALRRKAQELALRAQARALSELSHTDALTGLGNRRQLEVRAAELTVLRGPGAPAGVLMADIDHFKAVNDSVGHAVGDEVLRIAAARMHHALDDPDATLVRWGGEEFLVLAPGVAGEGLAAMGERLRAAVAGSPFAVGGGRRLEVTVSVGAAGGRLDGLQDAARAADEALYDAKRSGRNRVATSHGVVAPTAR